MHDQAIADICSAHPKPLLSEVSWSHPGDGEVVREEVQKLTTRAGELRSWEYISSILMSSQDN